MEQLLFVTGSANKLAEARAILPIPVEQLDVDLNEIQDSDPKKIVAAKLKLAYIKAHSPVIVEDVSAELKALNGFPGPFVKFAERALGDAALYELLKGHENKQATIRAIVGMTDGETDHFFEGVLHGTIVAPRGEGGFGFDKVFVPDGHGQTMAEMPPEQKHGLSHRYLALSALADFLQQQS